MFSPLSPSEAFVRAPPSPMVRCYSCGHLNASGERVGRRDVCESCRSDLHVCRNCEHFDSAAYNQCRESQADRVVEKERANFCDFFSPVQRDLSMSGQHDETAEEKSKRLLEKLFRKSSS